MDRWGDVKSWGDILEVYPFRRCHRLSCILWPGQPYQVVWCVWGGVNCLFLCSLVAWKLTTLRATKVKILTKCGFKWWVGEGGWGTVNSWGDVNDGKEVIVVSEKLWDLKKYVWDVERTVRHGEVYSVIFFCHHVPSRGQSGMYESLPLIPVCHIFLLQPPQCQVSLYTVLPSLCWSSSFYLPRDWQFCSFPQVVVFSCRGIFPSLHMAIPVKLGIS